MNNIRNRVEEIIWEELIYNESLVKEAESHTQAFRTGFPLLYG